MAPGDIIGTNILTKFHEDLTINVNDTVLTRQIFMTHNGKSKAQTKLPENQETRKTNVLTKFHEDWAKNVSSRLFTCFHYIHIEKTAPSPGGHVFPPIMTIFKLVRDSYKFDKTAPPPSGNVFSPIWTIFEIVRDINETNVLTKFHDDWAKIVTSRVFTRSTAPPPGRHIFQRTGIIF
ncbi:hypothetical protein DPMN_058951 [Dreissena polymorpha]|uniref:Uncharacterized protein n=1 Tax=Dreissena polymorpha TaxID=45954 RepID=A0A9D4C2P2_DREPO|nr:hypothetical protein DPMN_058951 [Dreissena polymorpha]